MSQREPKQPHLSEQVVPLLDRTDFSADSILKLRVLISQLMAEVEALDERSLPLSEESHPIDFYEETKRFEIALIKRALRQTNGHQLLAARLLNLNPTTLNAKIKQYGLKSWTA
ncbi:MAG TPA: helix-turn-helix domain-containing protein [Pyrinomonadaceae bacterium]